MSNERLLKNRYFSGFFHFIFFVWNSAFWIETFVMKKYRFSIKNFEKISLKFNEKLKLKNFFNIFFRYENFFFKYRIMKRLPLTAAVNKKNMLTAGAVNMRKWEKKSAGDVGKKCYKKQIY